LTVSEKNNGGVQQLPEHQKSSVTCQPRSRSKQQLFCGAENWPSSEWEIQKQFIAKKSHNG